MTHQTTDTTLILMPAEFFASDYRRASDYMTRDQLVKAVKWHRVYIGGSKYVVSNWGVLEIDDEPVDYPLADELDYFFYHKFGAF